MARLSKNARKSEERVYNISESETIKAQLVDIDFYPRMSEETLAFNAVLTLQYGNIVCKYDCANDGHGGCTMIDPQYYNGGFHGSNEYTEQCRLVYRKWTDFLSTQRDDKFYEVAKQMGWNVSDKNEVKKDAEGEVNNLLAEWCDLHNL